MGGRRRAATKPASIRLERPALVSFSGGRTSGYMLYLLIQAHDGELPSDTHVVFANTGKERTETLDFVHECAKRWSVDIHWLERSETAPGFTEVTYGTASRSGEPFQALIDRKKRLPNWRERWCTQLLKVQPMIDFMASKGHALGEYDDVIGLRYDEGVRVLKGLASSNVSGRRVNYPLARKKVTVSDVHRFWAAQPFDLQLEPWQGNCDLCFLKGPKIRQRIIRQKPEIAQWWASNETQEKGKNLRGWWSNQSSVSQLTARARASAESSATPDDEHDVECGLHCGYEPEEDEAA